MSDLLARADARLSDPDAAGCDYGDCELIRDLAAALRDAQQLAETRRFMLLTEMKRIEEVLALVQEKDA